MRASRVTSALVLLTLVSVICYHNNIINFIHTHTHTHTQTKGTLIKLNNQNKSHTHFYI
jgi:hypothetical protein